MASLSFLRSFRESNRLLCFSIHLHDKPEDEGADSSSFGNPVKDDNSGKREFEFYPGSGKMDDLAHNIYNVPMIPIWKDDRLRLRYVLEHGRSHRHMNADWSGLIYWQRWGKSEVHLSGAERLPLRRGRPPDPDSQVLQPQGELTAPQCTWRACPCRALSQGVLFRCLQLIILSMGFDILNNDVGNAKHHGAAVPQAGLDLSPGDVTWVTRQLQAVADMCCNGRMVSVLEGGFGTSGEPSRFQGVWPHGDPGREHVWACYRVCAEGSAGLNRSQLGVAAAAHVSALIDPYQGLDDNDDKTDAVDHGKSTQ
jgi:hypothetical protein